MRTNWMLITAGLCAVTFEGAWAQPPRIVTLDVGFENAVTYVDNISDPSQLATSVDMANPSLRGFMAQVTIADIVTVNGKQAKGTAIANARFMFLGPSAASGQAIADVSRGVLADTHLEILQSDGTPIGSIMSSGFVGGAAPPGAASGLASNSTVTGGTGAFFAARGALMTLPFTTRLASMQEDPSKRRINGGGPGHFSVSLIPLWIPEVTNVFHADFSPVTAAKPAHAGETLIVAATGLGPTIPALDAGKTFPSDTLAAVNSPVEVTVNGNAAVVVNKAGWPGTTDTYRLDIRVPDGTTPGLAKVQLAAAFIPGREVSLPVQ